MRLKIKIEGTQVYLVSPKISLVLGYIQKTGKKYIVDAETQFGGYSCLAANLTEAKIVLFNQYFCFKTDKEYCNAVLMTNKINTFLAYLKRKYQALLSDTSIDITLFHTLRHKYADMMEDIIELYEKWGERKQKEQRELSFLKDSLLK